MSPVMSGLAAFVVQIFCAPGSIHFCHYNRETYPQAISPEVVPSEWEKEADKSHYAKTKSLPNSNPVQKKISLTELRAKSVNNTDLAKAARALPDPKTLKIDVVERPATKPNTPASKKPINSYFVPQGRTTTIASSSLLDYPKESDRQSTSEPGEPGSESHLEIITEDETLESYHPDFQPLLQTVKLQLKHYREAVLKTNDNLKIVSLKVASVTQEGLCMHIPLKEFLAIFNQWNPLKEFHRLMEENDLLMEELEAQGINTKRSTIILNKFKDTQAEDQAQSTKMEIGSTTQRQHKPIPSQGLSKNSHSTSQPVACNLPQQAPRLNQWSVPTTGRNVRMNAQGPHHQLQEDGRWGTSNKLLRIQLRPFTEIKNLIGQKSDFTNEKLKSIKFLSENVVSLLNTLKPLLDFSKTLLSSSQSSTETLGSINKSQTDVLNLLWSSIVNKTDLSFLSSHVKNSIRAGFDHLFSLVFDKLSSFEKCMNVCASDNKQTLKEYIQENNTQISTLLAEATPIKNNGGTEDYLESHRSIENHCAKEHLKKLKD
ncbi:hypothetical protein PSHT_15461 [Puccinia striiformis]|uniref:Uncharacterized protein n=1 Tax=Puccinia striiformis TaxID=27350 RepID=A0A2S4UEY9_9BASI|nr:hypothetical protein PSHT_15461 [Puccinia striiformis]